MQNDKNNTINDSKNKKTSVYVNKDGDTIFKDENGTENAIYFRFDNENQFRGKNHKSGVSMWEENVYDLISDNDESYFDENDNYIINNKLLENYGVTREDYDNMSLKQQDEINRQIAEDNGWITDGASVFDLTNEGLSWFKDYDSSHHETDYSEVNFFTGKKNGEGADGENIVIPDRKLLKITSEEFKEILDTIDEQFENSSDEKKNTEFMKKIVSLIDDELSKENHNTEHIQNRQEKSINNGNIRSMKTSKISNNKQVDNMGRTLSRQQQEYFKDSKVRDEKGNLQVVYHGTNNSGFTEFKRNINFYTNRENIANTYTGNGGIYKGYLDIKKPIIIDAQREKWSMIDIDNIKIDEIDNVREFLHDQGVSVWKEKGKTRTSTADLVQAISDAIDDGQINADGIIIKNIYDEGSYNNGKSILGTDYITFKSNQFKNLDNTKPTGNQDIRFSKERDIIEPGQTNAQREGSYIEDEIKTVEATGNWDDSIPVTKLSDINKVIEDYLGLGIKRGKFRQRAYGIYKGNRDVLRVKEYKDMDTLLHETGHALDLGNRIKVDKESIADELFKAIDRYGGYEDESRTIRLDEGFAEVVREYGIKPTQAKIDYPQTVAVLENIREADQSFDNFITKVQEMTYNYIHQNPENRVLSNISIGEQTDKEPVTKQRIRTEVMRNIYDSNYALKEAVSKLSKNSGKTVNDLRASENAYLLTRLSSGIGEKVTSMLADGYIDENGNKLFEGLNKMGEILGDDPQRYNDLRAYLVAQRDLEYKAKTLKTGIRTMDSRAVINQFKNDTEIQEAAKLVYNTVDGVLQYAVNNNLITAENAKALRESNAFYVPMQRVLENDRGNNVGRRGAVSSIIKQRTGSELDIKDILENIVSNSANIIQQVENNNVLKALYKQGESSGMTGVVYDIIPAPMTKIGTATLSTWESELRKQGVNTNELDLEKSIDLFAPNNKVDTNNLITSFIDDDGKRIYLQFNDEMVFNNILGMDKKFMSKVLKINSKLNMPLRYGATMANVGFAIPNMISDTAQAAIYSTAGFVPVIDNAIGVLDILAAESKTVSNFLNKVAPEYASKVNFMYQLYRQSGSPSSTRLSQYRKSTQENMNKIYGTTGSTLGINERFKPLKRVMDLLTYVPDISEQSTRFRVFQKNYDYYKSRGNSEMDARIMAAIEARDATQDFGRTGNITREINQLIPFSAARVGSSYTFSEKVSTNPKMIGTRIAILTAIAMTIKAIGYDDDEIEELVQRKKDDNFVLKIGEDIVTIKKPQGILRSIINLSEYIQDLATGHIEEGKEGERLGEWLNNAIMDNMPADEVTGLVPNAVAPLIENAINKDFYYNTDIVKSYDLELPDSEQYYDYNSQLAILLGKVFNYSPAKIDNLISGYFAGLGTSVTNMIDYGLGKLGVIPEKPEMGAESNAVGKRFIVNVNSNSQSVNDIYDRKTELTKKKNGGTITSKETEELETITQAISQLSALNKQIKSIKADKKLSGDEKAEQIKELQKQKTDTARQALGKKLIYKDNQSKINSTKFYPSRSTLSLNGYSLTLTSDMMKEYENLAYKKYNEYAKQGIYSDEYLEKLEDKCKDYAKKTMLQKYKSQLVKTK